MYSLSMISRILAYMLVAVTVVSTAGAFELASDSIIRDACDGDDLVRLRSIGGDVYVRAGETKRIKLPDMTRQFNWWCGRTRESMDHGRAFNEVEIRRAANGAITWRLFVTTGLDLYYEGETREACDRDDLLDITARVAPRPEPFTTYGAIWKLTDRDLLVKAGETRSIPFLANEEQWNGNLYWYCGEDSEVSRGLPLFTRLLVNRAPNGAIQYYFFRSPQPIADLGIYRPQGGNWFAKGVADGDRRWIKLTSVICNGGGSGATCP